MSNNKNSDIKSLTLEYFREWIKRGQQPGDRLKQRIIELNLGLVGTVAGQIVKTTSVPFDDLYNTGVIGLARAAQRYNPEKGIFSSYAIRFIRGAIQQHLRDKEASLVRCRAFYDKVQPVLSEAKRIGAPAEDVAQAKGYSLQEWREMEAVTKRSNVDSLDSAVAPTLHDGGNTMKLCVNDEERDRQQWAIASLLSRLPSQTVDLILYRQIHGLSVGTIAKLYGKPIKSVKQEINEALKLVGAIAA